MKNCFSKQNSLARRMALFYLFFPQMSLISGLIEDVWGLISAFAFSLLLDHILCDLEDTCPLYTYEKNEFKRKITA